MAGRWLARSWLAFLFVRSIARSLAASRARSLGFGASQRKRHQQRCLKKLKSIIFRGRILFMHPNLHACTCSAAVPSRRRESRETSRVEFARPRSALAIARLPSLVAINIGVAEVEGISAFRRRERAWPVTPYYRSARHPLATWDTIITPQVGALGTVRSATIAPSRTSAQARPPSALPK